MIYIGIILILMKIKVESYIKRAEKDKNLI